MAAITLLSHEVPISAGERNEANEDPVSAGERYESKAEESQGHARIYQPEETGDEILTGAQAPVEVLPGEFITPQTKAGISITYKIAGYSFLGEPIISWEITPEKYNKIILLTFAQHGFEDGWYRDGQSLSSIAIDIIREFIDHPEDLGETKLLVIPCVNPDGALNGWTGTGVGRCNAQGIDINRDFDYYWQYSAEKKFRTGESPFTTPEAQILREVVLSQKPDIIIDFHGWLNCTYGDVAIGDYFTGAFDIKRQSPADCTDDNYMQQYFTGWGSQYARTLLVEYPPPASHENMKELKYSQKTIKIIKEICRSL